MAGTLLVTTITSASPMLCSTKEGECETTRCNRGRRHRTYAARDRAGLDVEPFLQSDGQYRMQVLPEQWRASRGLHDLQRWIRRYGGSVRAHAALLERR